MKARLMFREQDFDMGQSLPPGSADLVSDLNLMTLFEAMSLGDKFLFEVSKTALLCGLDDPAQIAYRQDVLRDCVEHPAVIREIYAVTVAAIEGERKIWPFMKSHPSSIVSRCLQVLRLFVGLLRDLRRIADAHADEFASEGLVTLTKMLQTELDDGYFDLLAEQLSLLKFPRGVLVSAQLGKGNEGVRYVLRMPGTTRRNIAELIGIGAKRSYSFEISQRDDAGSRALSEISDRAMNSVANALAQSTDHLLNFFTQLRSEVGFYVGCLNLHDRLVQAGEPVCIPTALPWGQLGLSFSGLYDVCLALGTEGQVVGNEMNADGKMLVMITGANSGGKSTFLRSLGLVQLMMQCGTFVAAETFSGSVSAGLFTHFTRGEDVTMSSGRLDEELGRMNAIAEWIRPQCVMLFNESFASTNEREGSEIARQVVTALLEAGVRVFYVTHLFDLANGFYSQAWEGALFMRADRRSGGVPTFKLNEGEPLSTSFAEDVFRRLGGWTDPAAGSTGTADPNGLPMESDRARFHPVEGPSC